MNTLTGRQEETRDHHPGDREISLGTTMILGIFIALTVLCAVFFGFGYTLGAKHAALGVAAREATPAAPAFSGFKPPSGSPIGGAATKPPAETAIVAIPASGEVPGRTPAAAPVPGDASNEVEEPTPRTVVRTPFGPAPATTSSTPAAPPSGAPSMVQIAAVSHQEDADLIASTLKRRGYAVVIRQEPQDKLLHVQIGPFTAKKDAEAMRLRLQADGFNAYIK